MECPFLNPLNHSEHTETDPSRSVCLYRDPTVELVSVCICVFCGGVTMCILTQTVLSGSTIVSFDATPRGLLCGVPYSLTSFS